MSKSSGFLRNVIGRPCSPLSYTSDNIVNEALDLSELSRQLEKIRLNSQQQQQQQQKNVVTSISSELCGLFDNFSSADDDDMFSWQGKPGSCQEDDDDDINFSELFPEPGSGKISHSCSCQVEVKQSAKEGRNIEPISSSTSSFGKRKAAEMLECYNRDKTKKVTTRESVRRNKNKEANNLVCSLKASANQKPGFNRPGKKYRRTPEHQCRHC